MITLKVLKNITDSQTGNKKKRGDIWEVTEERLNQIRTNKEIKFDSFFEVLKVEKKVVAPQTEKKTRARKAK